MRQDTTKKAYTFIRENLQPLEERLADLTAQDSNVGGCCLYTKANADTIYVDFTVYVSGWENNIKREFQAIDFLFSHTGLDWDGRNEKHLAALTSCVEALERREYAQAENYIKG